jgi:hypothetical protein
MLTEPRTGDSTNARNSLREVLFLGRRAFCIENDLLRVVVTANGGHIAEIFHKPSQVNPLWTPIWPSIDSNAWEQSSSKTYGDGAESRLLASVVGHYLCLDTFGTPSVEEQAAGMPCHGEAPLSQFHISGSTTELKCTCELAVAQLRMTREIRLAPSSTILRIQERVDNRSASDRPIAWTQHVTIGPPFLKRTVTQFRIPDVRAMSLEGEEVGPEQASTFTTAECSGGFVTHLIDKSRKHGFFLAFSPESRILFGYVWHRDDFPWIGVWEENHLRQGALWNGGALARGMEFGVSPFPESRQSMIDRGKQRLILCLLVIKAGDAARHLVHYDPDQSIFQRDATTEVP